MNDAVERFRVQQMREIAQQIKRVNARFSKACQQADQRKMNQCIREHDALISELTGLRKGEIV
jgi:hypothetical protein